MTEIKKFQIYKDVFSVEITKAKDSEIDGAAIS